LGNFLPQAEGETCRADSMIFSREAAVKKGEKLVIIGMGGVGGPAAMLSRRLLPGVDITVIREEDRFIVR